MFIYSILYLVLSMEVVSCFHPKSSIYFSIVLNKGKEGKGLESVWNEILSPNFYSPHLSGSDSSRRGKLFACWLIDWTTDIAGRNQEDRRWEVNLITCTRNGRENKRNVSCHKATNQPLRQLLLMVFYICLQVNEFEMPYKRCFLGQLEEIVR